MLKVYIAGPYNATNVIDVLRNIGRGQEIASKVFEAGYAPFCPWLDKEFVINNWREPQGAQKFRDYSMEWLKACDCVLIVPNIGGMINWNESPGTLAEIEEAKKLRIPICFDMDDLYWMEYKKQNKSK